MARWETFRAFLDDAQRAPERERPALVDALLAERAAFPWVEGEQATFVYRGPAASVALNLDVLPGDPPFAPFTRLDGTDFWYYTHTFQTDDLLDYLLAIDDPGTPLKDERDLLQRVARHWRADPLNPLRLTTAQQTVSILRMGAARPIPDWAAFAGVPRGTVKEHVIASAELGFRGRKLWIYTPPNYDQSDLVFPLVVLHDGQWMVGPLQVPQIVDTLIKHGRMQPAVVVMIQSASGPERDAEYIGSDAHFAFLVHELLPDLLSRYYIDATRTVIGGVDVGAVAAAFAAVRNPITFSRLILISPPLGKGAHARQVGEIAASLSAPDTPLPRRIFLSVGRYEAKSRFVKPARALAEALSARPGTRFAFAEIGSGHGLVGFKSVLPEALAWALPGPAQA
jgi:enterochelin esterase-like enzyme